MTFELLNIDGRLYYLYFPEIGLDCAILRHVRVNVMILVYDNRIFFGFSGGLINHLIHFFLALIQF